MTLDPVYTISHFILPSPPLVIAKAINLLSTTPNGSWLSPVIHIPTLTRSNQPIRGKPIWVIDLVHITYGIDKHGDGVFLEAAYCFDAGSNVYDGPIETRRH
jgi:hypothetical protein